MDVMFTPNFETESILDIEDGKEKASKRSLSLVKRLLLIIYVIDWCNIEFK